MSTPKDDQDELDLICGKSALLQGEDRKLYDRLYAQLYNEHLPNTFMERLRVREMTDAIWESMRFKRLGTKLIGTGYREALQVLVGPCVGYLTHKANDLARDYYCDSPKRRELAAAQLDSYGITDDQIQAKALSMIGPDFSFLDRLAANRVSTRNALVKEHNKEQKRSNRSDRPREQPGGQPGSSKAAALVSEGIQDPAMPQPATPSSVNDNSTLAENALPPRNLKRRGEV
jgi:hypothetical protein